MLAFQFKKRLTAAVLSFTLIFSVGAAFAVSDGVLQFAGGIGVGEPGLHVIWDSATTSAPSNPASVTTNVARIVDFQVEAGQPGQPGGAPPHTIPTFLLDQRIEWAIGFVDAGSVTLTGRAENVGQLDAMVLPPGTTWWEDNDPNFSTNHFTISHAITGNSEGLVNAFPFRLNVGETVDLAVTVTWAGTLPIGGFAFGPGLGILGLSGATTTNWRSDNWLGHSPLNPGGVLYNYTWANNFMLSLVYTVAP